MYVARHTDTAEKPDRAKEDLKKVCERVDPGNSLHHQLLALASVCQAIASGALAMSPRLVETDTATVRTRCLPYAAPLQLPKEEEQEVDTYLTSRFYGEHNMSTGCSHSVLSAGCSRSVLSIGCSRKLVWCCNTFLNVTHGGAADGGVTTSTVTGACIRLQDWLPQ